MTVYVFHRSSTGSNKTVLVEADNELEARGKAQKFLPNTCIPEFKGEASDLLDEEPGILEL